MVLYTRLPRLCEEQNIYSFHWNILNTTLLFYALMLTFDNLTLWSKLWNIVKFNLGIFSITMYTCFKIAVLIPVWKFAAANMLSYEEVRAKNLEDNKVIVSLGINILCLHFHGMTLNTCKP